MARHEPFLFKEGAVDACRRYARVSSQSDSIGDVRRACPAGSWQSCSRRSVSSRRSCRREYRRRASLRVAETGGAMTLFGATYPGIPVSTMRTLAGSIIGVGMTRKISAVYWNVATSIVLAWAIILPATALIGAIFYWLSG
ncbi:MAG: hypothetical protein GEU95_09840 [Rhizobiales bacterium]|nr:hypothetical protein [Hyphomicrobiales bacterium]